MTTIPDTVVGYSEYATKEFLQTVVFVDDQIYEGKDGSVAGVKKVTPPKNRQKALKSATSTEQAENLGTISEEDEEFPPEEEEEFSPHDIVTSFAKKQIICSLYQPNESEKVTSGSDIFLLCRAADIVIVDWDLYGDRGKWAFELIDQLIKQAVHDVPEQLRLILVYTQEMKLDKVAGQLYEKVHKGFDDALKPLREDNGLAFHTANSRVSILGKATGRARPGVDESHIVKEKDLADIAVREFAKLASGLLHAATLLSLAEIKKNSRKVLSKFNATLDPAFLTHLAMCLPEEDASEHVVPLLVSEIEAVLQDVLRNPLISKALLSDWCQTVWQPGAHAPELLGVKDIDSTRPVAEAICLEGFDAAKKQFNQIPNLNKNPRKAAEIFLPTDDDKANHHFSRLMASRTFYGDAVRDPKTLRLGSVVYASDEDTYLLCVQPICDSERLKDDTDFVFVELEEVVPGSGRRVSHIVDKGDGEFVELYYQPKSYRCRVATFVPDPRTKLVQSEDKKLEFSDTSGQQYEWVDELKMAHAQRAVEKLARDLSRVGLTEAEWLRRLDKQ